ncbi:MAG: periplasmic nitrate reductase, NapE protein [Candidatus Muproteobacteria bacterium RBG_16_60_9]|uniref:Periplasmic nitrate reductase, NapE protein n=1 Tax=Candidatus Muproteobacteria bacterium RBG_16_60_9 TaxID=1817755 RepID=A0A1F6V332_9PROT|nr:MAG: periplasmic nitrate reductase, NapE protein [Candidatus Muproteobacteria bacterium RBG_16_60_9]
MTDAKRNELKAFLFLTAVIVPLLAVAIVGAFGLVVWVYQLVAGPPTG